MPHELMLVPSGRCRIIVQTCHTMSYALGFCMHTCAQVLRAAVGDSTTPSRANLFQLSAAGADLRSALAVHTAQNVCMHCSSRTSPEVQIHYQSRPRAQEGFWGPGPRDQGSEPRAQGTREQGSPHWHIPLAYLIPLWHTPLAYPIGIFHVIGNAAIVRSLSELHAIDCFTVCFVGRL